MDLRNVKSLTIVDERDYDPEKCNNGGKYRYFEDYFRNNPDENFIVSYNTSAEFDYCQVQGAFQSCNKCSYNEEIEEGEFDCVAEYNQITEQELQQYINNLKEGEYVSYIEEF